MAELRRISFPNGSHSVEARNGEEEGYNYHHQPKSYQVNSYKKSSYELEVMKKNGEKKHANDNGAPAVVIRNASKHFTKGVPVLDNFNMTVQRGAIYSLLGSSGCGKTTTLACIVGVRKLNEGNIWVFGAKPGVKGKHVGFMPQETSLYGDFSIAETLSYFGTLCGMDRDSAAKGTAFLTELLRLPPSSRRVGTLSGGQRRRVSFAVALIHDPELLILDEPTVGVDPLLRESIWNHLVRLSKERGTTVLITTHYIDEAKDSNAVGVMRDGRLLVEQDPALLLHRFNTTSLETVVLHLCRKEAAIVGENSNSKTTSTGLKRLLSDAESPPDDSKFTPPVDDEDTNVHITDSVARIKSLVYKNIVVLFRNLLLFIFTLIIPSFIIWVMCIAFKDDPKNLDFGIVNLEVTNASLCLNRDNVPGECDVENLSCKYLENIPADVIDMIHYKSEDEAIAAVHAGSVWGYILFPEGYSSYFYERAATGANVDEEVLNKSEIVVKMDQTSKNIVNRIKKSFHDGFEDYAKNILRDCGFDERQAEFTLNYHEPVFGTDDTKFIDFVAPSITVIWLYFFPIIAASIRYINEKKQGTFERSLVAGTKTWEVLFAYGMAEGFVLVLQSLLAYFVLTVLIGIEVLGSIPLVLFMFLLCGFGGVSMGFFIGSLCNEEIEAALLAMALFFPNVFVSGVLWPLEGMPIVLQYIAYFLPCTLTGEAMRSIFARGWTLSHPNVWPGFAALFGWISFYFVLTVLIQKFKTK
ncbi:unnamed protein product [Orchesella dallaii]|uniref:ABC transporter G family member 20 n=1 Tax=Orchesella dallaii TaxID=48710 RepID=A0ABP1PTB5_9HEXA